MKHKINWFFSILSSLSLTIETSSSGDYVRTVSTAAMTINDSVFLCRENFADARTHFLAADKANEQLPQQPAGQQLDATPIIYFVTPTYPRREQIAELTRLGQTLMHIPNLHWIVADDIDACNTYLDTLLNRFGKYANCINTRNKYVTTNTLIFASTFVHATILHTHTHPIHSVLTNWLNALQVHNWLMNNIDWKFSQVYHILISLVPCQTFTEHIRQYRAESQIVGRPSIGYERMVKSRALCTSATTITHSIWSYLTKYVPRNVCQCFPLD